MVLQESFIFKINGLVNHLYQISGCAELRKVARRPTKFFIWNLVFGIFDPIRNSLTVIGYLVIGLLVIWFLSYLVTELFGY